MNATVVRSTYKKADLDKVTKQYKQAIAAGAGSGMLLLDQQSGESISIGFFEDVAAAEAFKPSGQRPEIFEVAASTSQEAKSVVERGIKAFNAHDAEAIARDLAPNAEGTAPGGVTLKGPQAIKEYNQGYLTAFPDARAEPKKIVAQGNNVVVQGVFTGTHNGPLKMPMGVIPATGQKVKGDYVQVFEVDRGLIKKGDLIFDQIQLMTQLGFAATLPQKEAKPAGR